MGLDTSNQGRHFLTLAQHDSGIKIKTCTQNYSAICNQVLYVLFLNMYWAAISGEHLQDHFSSGLAYLSC